MAMCIHQWTCPYCLQEFRSKELLREHLEPNQQLVTTILRLLTQAQLPSCRKAPSDAESLCPSGSIPRPNCLSRPESLPRLEGLPCPESPPNPEGAPGPESLCTSDEEDGDNLRCPHLDCRAIKGRWNKKDHLLRHYKKHTRCNVVCKCGQPLNSVDKFEKHIKSCRLLCRTEYEADQLRFQTLKKTFHAEALQDMNQQLAKYQKKHDDTPEIIKKEQRQDSVITYGTVDCQVSDAGRSKKRPRLDQADTTMERTIRPTSSSSNMPQLLNPVTDYTSSTIETQIIPISETNLYTDPVDVMLPAGNTLIADLLAPACGQAGSQGENDGQWNNFTSTYNTEHGGYILNEASGGGTGLPNNAELGHYAFNNGNTDDRDPQDDWFKLYNIDDWETFNTAPPLKPVRNAAANTIA